jgi:hypothetical protein
VIRTERDEVIEFAKTYKGEEWHVSSIDAYRYKDTGEWIYSASLFKRNWDGIGDRGIRIMIIKVNGTYQGRLAELSKWPNAWRWKR